jgi:hypothetical protein
VAGLCPARGAPIGSHAACDDERTGVWDAWVQTARGLEHYVLVKSRNVRKNCLAHLGRNCTGKIMDSYLSSVVGKILLFKVTGQFIEQAQSLIQTNGSAQLLYGKLIAVDAVGCWVENPRWSAIEARTNEKNLYMAHVLIPWHAFVSAAVFPDRTFAGVPDERDAQGIGFHAVL